MNYVIMKPIQYLYLFFSLVFVINCTGGEILTETILGLERTRVEIPCFPQGYNDLNKTVHWSRDGKDLPNVKHHTYVIEIAKIADSGMYKCDEGPSILNGHNLYVYKLPILTIKESMYFILKSCSDSAKIKNVNKQVKNAFCRKGKKKCPFRFESSCIDNNPADYSAMEFKKRLNVSVYSTSAHLHSKRNKTSKCSADCYLNLFKKIILKKFKDAREKLIKQMGDKFQSYLAFNPHVLKKECPTGTEIYPGDVCIPCSPGAYEKQRKCQICPYNFYQDHFGQTKCKKCPDNKETNRKGTQSKSECLNKDEIRFSNRHRNFLLVKRDQAARIMDIDKPMVVADEDVDFSKQGMSSLENKAYEVSRHAPYSLISADLEGKDEGTSEGGNTKEEDDDDEAFPTDIKTEREKQLDVKRTINRHLTYFGIGIGVMFTIVFVYICVQSLTDRLKADDETLARESEGKLSLKEGKFKSEEPEMFESLFDFRKPPSPQKSPVPRKTISEVDYDPVAIDSANLIVDHEKRYSLKRKPSRQESPMYMNVSDVRKEANLIPKQSPSRKESPIYVNMNQVIAKKESPINDSQPIAKKESPIYANHPMVKKDPPQIVKPPIAKKPSLKKLNQAKIPEPPPFMLKPSLNTLNAPKIPEPPPFNLKPKSSALNQPKIQEPAPLTKKPSPNTANPPNIPRPPPWDAALLENLLAVKLKPTKTKSSSTSISRYNTAPSSPPTKDDDEPEQPQKPCPWDDIDESEPVAPVKTLSKRVQPVSKFAASRAAIESMFRMQNMAQRARPPEVKDDVINPTEAAITYARPPKRPPPPKNAENPRVSTLKLRPYRNKWFKEATPNAAEAQTYPYSTGPKTNEQKLNELAAFNMIDDEWFDENHPEKFYEERKYQDYKYEDPNFNLNNTQESVFDSSVTSDDSELGEITDTSEKAENNINNSHRIDDDIDANYNDDQDMNDSSEDSSDDSSTSTSSSSSSGTNVSELDRIVRDNNNTWITATTVDDSLKLPLSSSSETSHHLDLDLPSVHLPATAIKDTPDEDALSHEIGDAQQHNVDDLSARISSLSRRVTSYRKQEDPT